MNSKTWSLALVLAAGFLIAGHVAAATYDVSPGVQSGTLAKQRPVFGWQYPAGVPVTWVEFYINRNGQKYSGPWVERCGTCTQQYWTPTSDLPMGDYQFWMRGWGPTVGYGAWSSPGSFRIALPVPGVITLVSPSGLKQGTTHNYTWNKDAHATWYHLYVNRNGSKWLDQWFQTSGTGQFSVNVSGHTPGATYQWWVESWSPGGYGPWSSAMSFTIDNGAPAAPTLISPYGSISEPRPTFKWNASSRAQWYNVYANRGSTKAIDLWTQSTSLTPPSNLSSGNYTWWVGAWNEASGQTVYSSAMMFTIEGTAPAAPTLVSPSGSITETRPVFKWNASARAEWYNLYVNRGSTKVIDQWTQSTSLQPSAALSAGSYTWWVGAWNQSSGEVVYSGPKTFSIAATSLVSQYEARAHELVNAYRTSNSRSALTFNSQVAAIARQHSQNAANGTITQDQFVTHYGVDSRRAQIRTFMSVANADISESVQLNQGYTDPPLQAVTWWKGSSGHNANMLDTRWNVTGIGAAQSSNGTWYFTQLFVRAP